MTQHSEPTENVMTEKINRTLKEEFLQYYQFFNHHQAIKAIRKAVKYYNDQRPHFSINFLTPSQAHSRTGLLKKRWKVYQLFQGHYNLYLLFQCFLERKLCMSKNKNLTIPSIFNSHASPLPYLYNVKSKLFCHKI